MFSNYSEIENSYRSKFIDRFREKCPVDNAKYVVSEKLHGSCLSVCVTADGEVSFRSRKRILSPNEEFFGYKDAVDKINMEGIIKFASVNDIDVQLYGELYGDGIQKGINYSREKQIRFFDVKFGGVYLSYDNFISFVASLGLPVVPIIMKDVSLEEALDFDVEGFKSMVNPNAASDNDSVAEKVVIPNAVSENIAEGIVIKPVNEMWLGHDRFVLKKKSSKFTEKKQKPKKPKVNDPIVDEWKPCVEQYVNEARMNALFSKEGYINDPKQIGHYIKLYMEDLYKDFIKDYPEFAEVELDKKQKKSIMNVQKEIVNMLQREL